MIPVVFVVMYECTYYILYTYCSVFTHNAIQVQLPPGKRSPRWGHSMASIITPSGLEAVVMFGGSSERFGSEWNSPSFSRLAETVIYCFGQWFLHYESTMGLNTEC